MKIYSDIIKPLLDFFTAMMGFILLSPIFIVILILLVFANSGQPFFFQKRPGKNEKIFSIIKFKTMNDKKDDDGELLDPNLRLTKIGKFIRNYSLDEIPQLLNVIKGDMSIVGPRPLLIRYLPRYNDYQRRRHEVKPGITGWAQVNGRNAISWDQKFDYDIEYVDKLSFLFDIKILFLTVRKVLGSDGIYNTDNEIVPDFMGSNPEEQNQH